MSADPGTLADSFVALQRLARSFDALGPDGRPSARGRERSLMRLVRQLGGTAVPRCARELASHDVVRAEWAFALLAHAAGAASLRPRVIRAATELAQSPRTPDPAKLRALALLGQLGAEAPARARLRDPAGARSRSLEELAARLGTRAGVARVADALVSAPGDDLADLIHGLGARDPAAASALAAELTARHEIGHPLRLELARARKRLPRPHRAPPTAGRVLIGRREDGRAVVVAASASTRGRARALCVLVDERGLLDRAHYADAVTRRDLERDIVAPLSREGYAFAAPSSRDAARLVARSARAAWRRRGRLPREYYLGRDLLGLTGEHIPARSHPPECGAAIARAHELMERGAPARARGLLEMLVRAAPRDAEVRAALGLSLMALGEPGSAQRELARAADLAPDDPVHQWNLAAAAHRAGRHGGCYLALAQFVAATDRLAPAADPDLAERRALASRYLAEYERLARLEHPETSAEALARAEEVFYEARLVMARGDAVSAVRGLREVVDAVPTHHGAWTHLGVAHGVLGDAERARESLERALALKPGDPMASEALRDLA